MRTVGPVDREYVLFNKNIIIFSELHNFFFQNPPGGVKHPQGAMGNYCSFPPLYTMSRLKTQVRKMQKRCKQHLLIYAYSYVSRYI